ncbi:MAG TPA: hypothetical protein DHU56_13415 [Marinobacter sp.]|nr:hypothetical protein [Marinobacter sp.]
MTLVIEGSENYLVKVFNNIKIRSFGWRKRLFRIFRPSETSLPVFIIGSGRSGTDIVTFTLNNSLFVQVYNEFHDDAFVNWRLKPLDHIAGLIHKSRAKVVAFKPIVETLRCRELVERFPDAKVLFAVRDYRDAVNSMVRFFGDRHIRAVKGWVKSDFKEHPAASERIRAFLRAHSEGTLSLEDASALYWLLYNDAYASLGLDNDQRVKLVSYEELVNNPREVTKGLAEFLDIPWSSRMTEGIFSKSVGKSPSPNISPEIEKECQKVWAYLAKRIVSAK